MSVAWAAAGAAQTAAPLPASSVERFARLALACVHQEYPNKIAHVLSGDADVRPPRALTPAFYGCYDWDSSVRGHWLLARLARLHPEAPFAARARAALARSLTPANIEGEVRYLRGKGRTSFERPYGLAWLLQLGAELREWDSPEARGWAAALAPLETASAGRIQDSLGRTAELDQRSQRLEMLNRLSTSLSGSLDPQHIMQTTVQELSRAVESRRASIVLFNDDGTAMLSAEYPAGYPNLPIQLPDAALFEHLQQTLGIFNTDDIRNEADLEPLLPYQEDSSTHSLLVLPLATGIYVLGLALLHGDRPSRFTLDESVLARTITNQAAVALQNAHLYAETHSLSQELEQRVVERTTQLAKEHQRTELLLRISTELTTSLDLEQVLNRTLVIGPSRRNP